MKAIRAVLFILSLASFGHAQHAWTQTYGGTGSDDGWAVEQTSDGGYVVAGRTYSFGVGNGDVWLIKTDASGDTLWTRTYGGSGSEMGRSVQQTSDRGYIIAATTNSFGAGSDDFWLIKTDSSGDTLWTRAFGGTYNDEAAAVQQTSDGVGCPRMDGHSDW